MEGQTEQNGRTGKSVRWSFLQDMQLCLNAEKISAVRMGARTLAVQIKAWRARQIQERANMVWPDLGRVKRRSGWKVGWGQVAWGLECQGKNKEGHLESSLNGGAKVSKLAV